jgi:DNA gyrase subunit A
MGIGIGMACSVPQYNLKEMNQVLEYLLLNPECDFNDIYIAPDFATGAVLLNEDEVKESMKNGKGFACKLRSVVDYDKKENCFVVTEIPYSVYTNTICGELENIINNEENPGIDRFNDLTGKTPLIKIYLTKKANPNKVLKYLYKNTSLQSYYSINFTMLDKGRFPKVFTWKEMLQAHIDHEKEIYRRGFEFDLRKIEERLHIIEALLKVIEDIDRVVHIIKTSESPMKARERLAAEYKLDDIQTKAILDMKLSRLAHLEVEKLKSEKLKLEKERNSIYNIINNEELFNNELIKGWREVANKFGDARRTQILNISKDDEEPTEKQELLINLSNQNNIYVTTTSTLYTQKRGGVGNKFKMSKGEYVIATASGTNLDTVLLFSNNGNCFHLTASELPFEEVIPIESLIEIGTNEKIKQLVFLNKKKQKEHIIFFTKKGILKKSKLSEYNIKRRNGVKALNLDNDDEIVSILFVDDERVGMMTARGQFVVCETKDIRAIGRVARGVKGITLNKDDVLVSAKAIPQNIKEYLSVSEKGYIKRTDAKDFSITGRATKGSKIHALKDSDDKLIDFVPLVTEREVIIVSSRSQIKINLNEVNLLSKGAQGTRSMKLTNSKIIGILAF